MSFYIYFAILASSICLFVLLEYFSISPKLWGKRVQHNIHASAIFAKFREKQLVRGEDRKAAEDNRYDRGNSGEKRASRDTLRTG